MIKLFLLLGLLLVSCGEEIKHTTLEDECAYADFLEEGVISKIRIGDDISDINKYLGYILKKVSLVDKEFIYEYGYLVNYNENLFYCFQYEITTNKDKKVIDIIKL